MSRVFARSALAVGALTLALAAPAQAGKKGVTSKPADNSGLEKKLTFKHQFTRQSRYRWSTAIAMLAGYFSKKPTRSCEVASYFDREANGSGRCCVTERDADEEIDTKCKGGLIPREATELMKWKFHLKANELQNPLDWDAIVTQLDAGRPVVALRFPRQSMVEETTYTYDYFSSMIYVDSGIREVHYEICIITGYRREASGGGGGKWLTYENPENYSSGTMRFDDFTGTPSAQWRWVASWAFGDSGSTSEADASARALTMPTGTATASIVASLPAITEAAARDAVMRALQPSLPAFRLCYEKGLLEAAPAAPTAFVTYAFSVEKGTPTWIRVAESQGLAPGASKCLIETMSKLQNIYPVGGKYSENQRIRFDLSKLGDAGAPAVAPPVATAQAAAAPSTTPALVPAVAAGSATAALVPAIAAPPTTAPLAPPAAAP